MAAEAAEVLADAGPGVSAEVGAASAEPAEPASEAAPHSAARAEPAPSLAAEAAAVPAVPIEPASDLAAEAAASFAAEALAGAGSGISAEAAADSAPWTEPASDAAASVEALAGPASAAPPESASGSCSGLPSEAAIRPNRRSQAARLAFLALTLAAGGYAVVRQWSRVQAGFAELGVLPLLGALVPAVASVGAMMLAWRGVLGALGSVVRVRAAARIFFTSQLGKYLPGSVWPVVAQMQLGRAYRIPRARSAAAAALAMLISLATALVLAAATLSVAGGAGAAGYWWAFAAVPVLVAGLHPRVANPALRTIFRVTRRPAIEPLTGETIAKTVARSLVGWLLAGVHIWILAVALGASPGRALLLSIGGYAFAWSVGFLIVFAPAGAGVRELILVAALQPVLDPGKAMVVALASRLVTIVADLVAAALTAREGHRRQDEGQSPDTASDPNPASVTATD